MGGAPKIAQPKAMPTPDSEQVEAARRRRIALANKQSGIGSTRLTSGTGARETLGG